MRLRQLFYREFSVAEASLLMMACFFTSAVLGAVRQLLFNAHFGVSLEANAYYAAFRLPDTLFAVIAGGALSNAMIPVLVSTERRDGLAAWGRLINLVLTTLLAVLAVVILLMMLFAPLFVRYLLAPGFDAATSQLTVALTRLMLVQPLILAGGSVAVAVLNSRSQFLLPGLSIICHNFAIITGILLADRYPAIGIYGPTLGVVGGGVLEVLVLLPGLMGQGRQLRPVWQPRDWHLREVVRLLIPNGLSIGVNYSGGIIDTAFASLTQQAVTLPALHNALLIGNLPITLLGQTIGQSTFPRLAAQADRGAWSLMRKTLLHASAIVISLSLCALLTILLAGRRLVQILFEHGEYGVAAGDLTYRLLLLQSVALPAYVCTEVLTRGLIALRDTRTPLYTNIIQQIGRAVLLTFLIQPMGAPAIPLAFAISATVETLILATVLVLKLGRLSLQSEQQVNTF